MGWNCPACGAQLIPRDGVKVQMRRHECKNCGEWWAIHAGRHNDPYKDSVIISIKGD